MLILDSVQVLSKLGLAWALCRVEPWQWLAGKGITCSLVGAELRKRIQFWDFSWEASCLNEPWIHPGVHSRGFELIAGDPAVAILEVRQLTALCLR